MNDPRKALIKAMVSNFATVTELPVYTRMPKRYGYPYIHISDIFCEEDGPKNSYQFKYQILLEVCYKGESSLTEFWDSMAAVKSLINNGVPFSLDSPWQIMDCRLVNETELEVLTDDNQTINVGAIRLVFRIE